MVVGVVVWDCWWWKKDDIRRVNRETGFPLGLRRPGPLCRVLSRLSNLGVGQTPALVMGK
jgi:hypothetical protein